MSRRWKAGRRVIGSLLFISVGYSCDSVPQIESRPSMAEKAGSAALSDSQLVARLFDAGVPANVLAVLESPHFTHDTELLLNCRMDTYGRAVNHPLVVADLWQMFGYGPAYRVRGNGRQLQFSDPTGIEGNVRLLYSEGEELVRVYYGQGKLSHWAAPALNEGSVILALQARPDDGMLRLLVSLRIQAGNSVAGAIANAGESIIEKHVHNRLRENMTDLSELLSLVERDPQAVRQWLLAFLGEHGLDQVKRYETTFIEPVQN